MKADKKQMGKNQAGSAPKKLALESVQTAE